MVYSFSPFGFEGSLVNVEVDIRKGIPAVDIVGLADSAVKESRERVMSAIRNSNLEFPSERVLISLSPADLKKEGAGFDLPLAVAILEAQYGLELKDQLFVMGELELGGAVRPVRAVQAGLSTALSAGIRYAIISDAEIEIPAGVKYKKVKNLTEAYFALCDLAQEHYETFTESSGEINNEFKVDFIESETLKDVNMLEGLKFAMAVACAGKHNIMAYGKPACGKTMVMQRMNELLPKLTPEEKASVNRIYSIAGLDGLNKNGERPFRMPHQTASIEGICGGGPNCRPGEITLAHNGILFLDEAAEFRTSVLQMLRVPLETHTITLSRAGRTTVYPAHFQLAMAVNPCPCGNYGAKDRICLCSAKSIEQYWKKFSAPLLDRVDIRFNCENDSDWTKCSFEELREMVARAWKTQYERWGKLNGDLTPAELEELQKDVEPDALTFLQRECEKRDYSPRARVSILKLSRTLADMFDYEDVPVNCIAQAIALRSGTPLETL